MLETRPPEDLRVEEVLELSGISTGSLYHHFDDFGHLVETALIARYLKILEKGAVLLEDAVSESRPKSDVKAAALAAGAQYAGINTPELRFERARILGMCESHPRMREALGEAQQDFTDRLTSIFERGQTEGGRINRDLDPRALAVFLQAYTFGRIVDDIVPDPMRQEDWLALVDTMFEQVVLVD